MIISDNILVGVSIKRYVDFYDTLKVYAQQLSAYTPEVIDHSLIGLVVYDDGKVLYEYYYTKYKDNVFLTLSIVDILTKEQTWSNTDVVTNVQMFENIRKQNKILDLEYYINNI
jgi:hypothetical protein